MPITYTNIGTANASLGVKFLVHAPPGYGKTDLLLTMPGEDHENLIVSYEAGLLTLEPANQLRRIKRVRQIPVAIISPGNPIGDLEVIYQSLIGQHGKQIKCVGFDSISEIAELVLSVELRTAKDPRQAYGRMQELMFEYIRKFRDIPGKHVYFTAKQEKAVDSDGVTRFAPMMPGKTMTQQLAHFFDEVFALTLLEAKDANGHNFRALRTRPNIQYQAKDRSGALDELEEPNLSKIIAKIQTA